MHSSTLAEMPVKPICQFELNSTNTLFLDLSVYNTDSEFKAISTSAELSAYIKRKLKEEVKQFAYGGYGENRQIYKRFEHFGGGNEHSRSIHLGVDIWAPAGTAHFAPFPAKVHSAAINDNAGDYGGTIILQHEMHGMTFHTLYGHLSHDSVHQVEKGMKLAAGEKLGELGDEAENGGWPPHLHFQVIKDMQGFEGDYPGVVEPEQKGKYLENCPNPDLILRTGLLPDLK